MLRLLHLLSTCHEHGYDGTFSDRKEPYQTARNEQTAGNFLIQLFKREFLRAALERKFGKLKNRSE